MHPLRIAAGLGIVALGALVLVLLPAPHWVNALGVVVLCILLPGLLLVMLLLCRPNAPPTILEFAVLGVAAGIGLAVVTMLLLSYLPGALLWWQTLGAFSLLNLLGLVAVALRRSPITLICSESAWVPSDGFEQPLLTRWVMTALVIVLLVGAFFRLANLGYSEFHSDEATVVLRSAGTLQGYESTLFLHRKGPTEILLVTPIFSSTDRLTELSARLPFALAGLTFLAAAYLLVLRLFGIGPAFLAGLLLALEGYMIAFSRIVQYQSIVLLMCAVTLLLLYRLWRYPIGLLPYGMTAALIWATGLLSHWDAAFIAPVVLLLAVALGNQCVREGRGRSFGLAVAAAIALGTVLLLLFYLPYVRHPGIQGTSNYLFGERIGSRPPYNNLIDFFLRTTVYNSTYLVGLLLLLTPSAVFYSLRSCRPRRFAWMGGLLVALLLLIALFMPGEIHVARSAAFALAFGLLFLLILAQPGLSLELRVIWLWLAVPTIAMFFLFEKPRSHVYMLMTPWIVLCGWAAWRLWQRAQTAVSRPAMRIAASLILGGAVLLFGTYDYWYFVHTKTEVLRTWQSWHPPGYWTVYEEPDQRALFGFPIRNGWKVAGVLYGDGTLSGPYESNENESWTADWYLRGAERCGREAGWYLESQTLYRMSAGDRIDMESFLSRGYRPWGLVNVNDAPRLTLYHRGEDDTHAGAPYQFEERDYSQRFDRAASPWFPLHYPVVERSGMTALNREFENGIVLESVSVENESPLTAGDRLTFTLYWRATAPVSQSLRVFNHLTQPGGQIAAQRDGAPVCDRHPTEKWSPGELIADRWQIAIDADTEPGAYSLVTGLYDPVTSIRIPTVDSAGRPDGDSVQVAEIIVANGQ